MTLDEQYSVIEQNVPKVHDAGREVGESLVSNMLDGSLEHLVIKSPCAKVRAYAFQYAKKLKTVAIEKNRLDGVFFRAFNYCEALEEFCAAVPLKLLRIGKEAFSGCSNLTTINLARCTSVPILDHVNAFDGLPDEYIVQVPKDLYAEWVTATNWSDIADHIVPIKPGQLDHEHSWWSINPRFVPYDMPTDDGVIGYLAPSCKVEGCTASNANIRLADVILNMDFETESNNLLDYVEGVNGVAPYLRTNAVTSGEIRDGKWYNTTFDQVVFDVGLDLENRPAFTVAFDFMLPNESTSGDRIFSWGASGGSMALGHRFMLSIDADGRLHYYRGFAEEVDGFEKLSGFVFDDRSAWYHIDIAVNVVDESVTVVAGKYTDADLTNLEEYATAGTYASPNGFFDMGDKRTNDCFRISDKKGLAAMDNLIVFIPNP